jgi:hypothetical protein
VRCPSDARDSQSAPCIHDGRARLYEDRFDVEGSLSIMTHVGAHSRCRTERVLDGELADGQLRLTDINGTGEDALDPVQGQHSFREPQG